MVTKESLHTELQEQLGTLNSRQLWALVKLAKFVRLRCRNNAAFNNAFSTIFPYAKFSTVTKKRADGTMYPGLSILVDNEIAPSMMEDSGDE